MKKSILFLAIAVTFFSLPAFSQTDDEPVALGLPGDNLNLYAVLDIFQKSKTLEDFEKALNEQDSKVNNLDLNNDGEIDYIEIESKNDGNIHSIVLQVAINSTEKQDVAVIEVDKDKKNNIHVQIIGDEDLYGKNYIVEPSDTVAGTPNPGYKGDGTVIVNNNTTNNYNTTSNPSYVTTSVNAWPVVLFLFSPIYVSYRSPWYWGYYPPYWRPWRPVYYHDYWGYHGHYYRNNYYRRSATIRNPRYYNRYAARRNTSVVVRDNRSSGRYNTTYNGRDYKRPAPVTSTRPTRPTRPTTTRPVTRPTNPSTRPGTTNPGTTRPVTRPTNPSTRPGTTRPITPTNPSTRPAVKPTNPTTRPVQPVTRPTQPVTRPVQPVTRPTRPATQPVTRPAPNRSTTPTSPASGGSGRR